jgi:hypothetical protein
MSLADSHRLHEYRDVVRECLCGVGGVRLVALAGATEIDREAREVLRILRHLKRVASVIGGEVRNEDERLPGSLLFVVDYQAVGVDSGHHLLVSGSGSSTAAAMSAFLSSCVM